MKKIVEVAVGLVFNPRQEILLAWRGADKAPGNCWEFTGGKIEPGETVYQALCRELWEEIGIQVQKARDFPSICHEYEDCRVRLHPWRVEEYCGAPKGIEGQMITWVAIDQLRSFTLPAPNYAIADLLMPQKIPIFIA